jgi:capsular polysaccharide biosynthesis protein
VRAALAQRVGRALLGPVSGALPANGVRSIDERWYDPALRAHVTDRRVYRPATLLSFDFPAEYPPQFRRSKALDARRLYRLHDVVVDPATGLVWLPGGLVLEESVGSLRRIVGWGGLLAVPLQPVTPLPGGPAVCLPGTSYFHWLCEVVPGLLAALDADPAARVLVAEGAPRYVHDLLGLLGREPVRAAGPVRVPDLWMAGVEPAAGFVTAEDLAALRALRGPAGSGPGRALYVSRRRAAARRLAGEQRLEAALRERGFDIVFCEDLSLPEQMERFGRAEVVVGPHGAGLANLVWAEPPCRLVEIFPATVFNDCYARMALQLGHDYRCVVAQPDGLIPVDAVQGALVA